MNEILDYDEQEISTNYKKWAFRFLIYLVFLSCLGFYLIPRTIVASETVIFSKKMLILGWVLKLFLCVGILFMILMIRNKETKDYKFWISLIGISFYFLVSIFFSFI